MSCLSVPKAYRFTVGVICALEIEYEAARLILNKTFDISELGIVLAQDDDNEYTCGRSGDHYVVITWLGDRRYGTNPAQKVASSMKSTFPSIRQAFMMGVGAGAPRLPQLDVRLGDVVFGTEIISHTFGKVLPDGFEVIGHGTLPPSALLAEARTLSTRVDIGERIRAIVETDFGFRRPEQESDRLYNSDFIHPDRDAPCSAVCNAHSSQLVPRTRRPARKLVRVHQGIIASGDWVMKDANKRDQFAENFNVVCFEMESTGVAEQLPCLPVRGICDYADSHKNKDWQPYSAACAAAFLKLLLEMVRAKIVFRARPVQDPKSFERFLARAIADAKQARSISLTEKAVDGIRARLELLQKALSHDRRLLLDMLASSADAREVEAIRKGIVRLETCTRMLNGGVEELLEFVKEQRKDPRNTTAKRHQWWWLQVRLSKLYPILRELVRVTDIILRIAGMFIRASAELSGDPKLKATVKFIKAIRKTFPAVPEIVKRRKGSREAELYPSSDSDGYIGNGERDWVDWSDVDDSDTDLEPPGSNNPGDPSRSPSPPSVRRGTCRPPTPPPPATKPKITIPRNNQRNPSRRLFPSLPGHTGAPRRVDGGEPRARVHDQINAVVITETPISASSSESFKNRIAFFERNSSGMEIRVA